MTTKRAAVAWLIAIPLITVAAVPVVFVFDGLNGLQLFTTSARAALWETWKELWA